MLLKIEGIKKQQVQSVAQLAADSFFNNNASYKNGKLTQAELASSTANYIRNFIEAQREVNEIYKTDTEFNHVYKLDGKIIGCFFSCEIQYYLSRLLKIQGYEQIEKLLYECSEMFQKDGKSVYQSKLCLAKDWMGKKLSKKMLALKAEYLLSKGYKNSFIVTYNPISKSLFSSMGGKIAKKVQETKEGTPLYLIENNLAETVELGNKLPVLYN